jgi:DNA-directed RNA polymerase subunit M
MKFCEKCGTLMRIAHRRGHAYWHCPRCGARALLDKEKVVLSEIARGEKEIVVVREEEELKGLPVTKIRCPKCEHNEAYWWMIQMRAADEPPTIFYRCKKCGHTWRT